MFVDACIHECLCVCVCACNHECLCVCACTCALLPSIRHFSLPHAHVGSSGCRCERGRVCVCVLVVISTEAGSHLVSDPISLELWSGVGAFMWTVIRVPTAPDVSSSWCSEELGEFMELAGASSPGILVLTTGLSKPFMRLDKYPALLKELERHMEVPVGPTSQGWGVPCHLCLRRALCAGAGPP